MDSQFRRPRGAPHSFVARAASHQIAVCTACHHTGAPCAQGFALLKNLRAAIAAAGLGAEFELSGTANFAGCAAAREGACLVGWRATAKATWLFGDIDPQEPFDDLIAFSERYAAGAALGTGPAAMIVTREGVIQ